MKSCALAAVVATGVLFTSGTADAQFFRGGGFGGGTGRGYNSYPGYGYSGYGYGYSYPGYGYSGFSNGGYGYPGSYSNFGYSNSSYPGYGYSAYSDPCCCGSSPGYSISGAPASGVTTSGYTPAEGTGTIVASGYAPVDKTGTATIGGTGVYSPTTEGTYYTYPQTDTSYPYYWGYSYPMYSSGRASRGLFGGMRR